MVNYDFLSGIMLNFNTNSMQSLIIYYLSRDYAR